MKKFFFFDEKHKIQSAKQSKATYTIHMFIVEYIKLKSYDFVHPDVVFLVWYMVKILEREAYSYSVTF